MRISLIKPELPLTLVYSQTERISKSSAAIEEMVTKKETKGDINVPLNNKHQGKIVMTKFIAK